MGFTTVRKKKQEELIAMLTEGWESTDQPTGEIYKIATTDKALTREGRYFVLWARKALYRVGQETPTYFIACYLLERAGMAGWSYKTMSEGMGPCYYSCPRRFLEETPKELTDEYNPEWRQKVINRQPEAISLG